MRLSVVGWVSAAAVSVVAVVGAVGGVRGVVILAVVAGGAALAWRLSRCSHSGPLGLQPPVTHPDGTRTPAMWFCDRCGKSWPAGFEQEAHVVRRFVGYDESKAAIAARRAEELSRQQRAMALKRAGYGAGRRARTPRPSADVVPMANVRHFMNK
jgi:hypothetical protein